MSVVVRAPAPLAFDRPRVLPKPNLEQPVIATCPTHIQEESAPTEVKEPKLRKTLSRVVEPARDQRWFRYAFLLGSVHLCLSAFWLGSHPSTFYKLYSFQAVALLALRWAYFKQEKMHYCMFDFCYAVNILLLAHVWFMPNSNFFRKVLFAYSTGPLAFSVIVFGNSLVYHSLHELTGLFIHWYPMLVTWTMRWFPDCADQQPCSLDSASPSGILTELYLWPVLPYLSWATLYYMKMFIVSSHKIKERSYETIYAYMMREDPMVGKLVGKFPARLQPSAFMFFHFCLVMLSIIPGILWWTNFTAHSAFLVGITGVSMWNGATVYSNVSL